MQAKNKQIVNATKKEDTALYTALEISTGKSGVYELSKADEANAFYFEYQGLKVPLSAIFDTNAKTAGILGVFFGTAADCPSRKLGLCQLPNDTLCYARSGEKRATRKNNESGCFGMDATFKGRLASYYWDLFETDSETRRKFLKYCEHYNIDTLRFNLKSDFRHALDAVAVFYLAGAGLKLTGYTARDDLAAELERIAQHPNVILNGSNRKYTNRFKCTDSVAEYMTADHRCKGSCANCRNCYRLRGETITVLIHGSGSDTQLNNKANQEFILSWSRDCLPWDVLRGCDFSAALGFITCINKHLQKLGVMLRFANVKELMNYIKKTGGF